MYVYICNIQTQEISYHNLLFARNTRSYMCASHSTQAAESLSEMIEFRASGDNASPVVDTGEGGSLRVVAGRDYGVREQFFILYGRYSNAKLLYR